MPFSLSIAPGLAESLATQGREALDSVTEQLTVKSLRSIAKELGIGGGLSRLKKDELVSRISEARQVDGKPVRLQLRLDGWRVWVCAPDVGDLIEKDLGSCIVCVDPLTNEVCMDLHLEGPNDLQVRSDRVDDWAPTPQLLRATRFHGESGGHRTLVPADEALHYEDADEAYFALPPFRALDAMTHHPQGYNLLRFGVLNEQEAFSIAAEGSRVTCYEAFPCSEVVERLFGTYESFRDRRYSVNPSPWVRDFWHFEWRGQPEDAEDESMKQFFEDWLRGPEN
jgi:hypothetical protein